MNGNQAFAPAADIIGHDNTRRKLTGDVLQSGSSPTRCAGCRANSTTSRRALRKNPMPPRDLAAVPARAKAADIYRTVGDDIGTIVEPQFRSAIREVTASYEATSLYSAERDKIATEIFTLFRRLAGKRGIMVQQVLLRRIGLPPVVGNATQEMLRREQEAEQMKFVLQKDGRRPSASASRRRASLISSGSSRRASARSCSNGRGSKRPKNSPAAATPRSW